MGLLLGNEDLLKKNIRRSFSSLKILLLFLIKNYMSVLSKNNFFLFFNSFLPLNIFNIYENALYSNKINIYGLIFSYFIS